MARSAIEASVRLANGGGDVAFLEAKLVSARFYAESVLARAPAFLNPITRVGESVMALAEEQF